MAGGSSGTARAGVPVAGFGQRSRCYRDAREAGRAAAEPGYRRLPTPVPALAGLASDHWDSGKRDRQRLSPSGELSIHQAERQASPDAPVPDGLDASNRAFGVVG